MVGGGVKKWQGTGDEYRIPLREKNILKLHSGDEQLFGYITINYII